MQAKGNRGCVRSAENAVRFVYDDFSKIIRLEFLQPTLHRLH